MELVSSVVVQRFSYEEPHHTQLSISASNGRYSGSIEIYCAVDELRTIGLALTKFPAKVPDEYVFEYGSEKPQDRFAYYLKIRAYTIGLRGRSALQFTMNLNGEAPHDGRSCFSIADLEPAQIERLGVLFVRLESHDNGYFRWSPTDEEFLCEGNGGAA